MNGSNDEATKQGSFAVFFLLDLADSAPENFILQLFYNYFDSRIVTYAHFPVDMVSVIS